MCVLPEQLDSKRFFGAIRAGKPTIEEAGKKVKLKKKKLQWNLRNLWFELWLKRQQH
jgi:hypothetical protein